MIIPLGLHGERRGGRWRGREEEERESQDVREEAKRGRLIRYHLVTHSSSSVQMFLINLF